MSDVAPSVLVIGAGFSGLAAALKLLDNGVEVQVIEATDRVGGRTFTRYLDDGLQIDLGGQWIGPTQTRMYELVKQYGIDTFPLRAVGESFAFFDGERHSGPDQSIADAYAALDELATTVDAEHPERTPDAASLDSQTLHTWLAARLDEERANYVARQLAGGLLAKDAGEVSLLQMLFYIRSGNGVASLLSSRGGAQQDRLIGGPYTLATKLAERLGDRLTLNVDAVSLTRAGGTWAAKSSDSREFEAQYVISAVPPIALGRMTIDPALPRIKRVAARCVTPGRAQKFHAVYSRPFWNDQGLSGAFSSSTGLITEAVDNSVPGSEKGVLTFFVYGHDTATLYRMDTAEWSKALLDEIADRLGDDRLREPEEFIHFSWDDEIYIGGCFSGSYGVGDLHVFGTALAEPVDGLHFAGTETSTVWNGYFEGAVRAGEREAEKVITAMARN